MNGGTVLGKQLTYERQPMLEIFRGLSEELATIFIEQGPVTRFIWGGVAVTGTS